MWRNRVLGRLFAVLAILWCSEAGAQVDIESRRYDGDVGLSGFVELDLTVRAGNVDLVEFGPGLLVNYRREEDTILLIASGDIGWEGDERFSNEALVHLRYARKISGLAYLESFVQSNYDKSRNLDFRAVTGGGLRLKITGSADSGLWFGSSYLFEHEQNDVAPSDPHSSETWAHRWSNYASGHVRISETATVSGTVYFQPEFTRFDDFRVLAEIGLDVSITAALSLKTSVSVRHDSDPVASVAESDFQLTTGILVEW